MTDLSSVLTKPMSVSFHETTVPCGTEGAAASAAWVVAAKATPKKVAR